ncbi:YeeE/YedE family protein [Parvularcula sp. LCG005]|uniref:YeeE/YedE family protein n=1 Tax=Parvularcula sp. LCG005 TaxID=3078805 RepID=UPI002943ED05|nr:YeeE/YedE family protein [Parvularcula sp. LCG005]WOI52177.1 YeeE/YedE family protein [Parvularcula sp. LCG005]
MAPVTMFTPVTALLGGAMIGLAATLLMLSLGRIAGISGILAGALGRNGTDRPWRLAFLAGLIAPGLALAMMGQLPDFTFVASGPLLIVAGLLVGFGTRLGSGCTSGHGVCGLARLSLRSLVAVLTFMAAGVVTVGALRHAVGGF